MALIYEVKKTTLNFKKENEIWLRKMFRLISATAREL